VTRDLGRYFLLTFVAAWVLWSAAATIPRDGATGALAGAIFLLGTFSPSLVALALTARQHGRDAAGALFNRIFKTDVSPWWYVFAIAFMPAIKLSTAAISRLITGAWPRFGTEPWYLMIGVLVVSVWVQAGEEIGWRGFALPRLAARLGLGPGSVVLGVIWAAWHLPLFLVSASDTFGQSFPLFLTEVTAMSVAMAWLYWRTGGSLLLVMLLHAAVNNTKDIVPSIVPGATDPFALSTSLVAWITAALLWVAAGYFLIRMRGGRLDARTLPQAQTG
jgi:membrane protease YdiL (CAAX protease family)